MRARLSARLAAMREAMWMNLGADFAGRGRTPGALADIARIEALWTEARARSGGPFLFGAACAADAMYAPVVSRFHTYEIAVDEDSRAYMRAVMALPAWGEWEKAARQESWVLPRAEVDWPDVLKA